MARDGRFVTKEITTTKPKEAIGRIRIMICIQQKSTEIDCKYFSSFNMEWYTLLEGAQNALERIWKLLIEVEINKWQDVSVLDSIIFNSKQTTRKEWHEPKREKNVNTLASHSLHHFFPFVSPMICIEYNLVRVF